MTDLVQIVDPRAQGPIDVVESHQAKPIKMEWSPRTRKREPGPRPSWLKVKYRRDGAFEEAHFTPGIEHRHLLIFKLLNAGPWGPS